MSFAINPEDVKRREYAGLTSLIVGLLFAITGLIGLLYSMPLGLVVLGLGIGLTATGIFVLTKIPDLVSDLL